MSNAQFPRLANVVALVLAAPFLLMAAAPSAYAQSNEAWGAIYYSDDKDGQFGSAWDNNDQDEASREAKKACRVDGGRNCELAVEFQTNECGALAEGADGWGAGYGPNKNAARSKALQDCRNESSQCEVIEVACNNGLDDGMDDQRSSSLAEPLQEELRRLGCYTGKIDGIWGRGSRAALARFAKEARLRLGNQPSQNALDEAKDTDSDYCPKPARVAPKKRKKKQQKRRRPSQAKKKVSCSKVRTSCTAQERLTCKNADRISERVNCERELSDHIRGCMRSFGC